MISLQSAIRSVDDRESLINSLLDLYKSTIEDQKQYVVEFDPPATETVRRSLATAMSRVSDPRQGCDLGEVRSLIRGILRDYQQDGERYLIHLREKLQEHAAALEQVVNSMTSDNDDSQEQLDRELVHLEQLAECQDLDEIRRQIAASQQSLRSWLDNVSRQNRFLVAQLMAEIQVLHKRVESLAHRADGMRIGGRDIRVTIESRLASGSGFSIVLVSLRNLAGIHETSGPQLAERTVHAALKRFANLLNPGEAVGAWSAGTLAAVLSNETNILDLTKLVSARMAGKYVFTIEAQRQEIVLQVNTGVVQYRPGEPPAVVYRRIEDVMRMFGDSK